MSTRRTVTRLPRGMLVITALAFALALTPVLHAHEAACAHDTSLLRCAPGAEDLSQADTMEKGDAGEQYAADTDPGEPGPTPPRSNAPGELLQLGHYNPGTSVADVWAHKRVAYLGSWAGSCLSSGVEAIDLRDPRNPTPLSTFADADSNPALDGSWTEKVIVQRVNSRAFRGDVAAVSFQGCRPGGFVGFGLYDVSDPANPQELALVPTASPYGVHELWLEVRANRAYVYTAANYAEWATGGEETDFMVFDVTDPRSPERIAEWGIGAEKGIGLFDDGLNFVHSVIGDGRFAYLSYWDQGTVLLDLRNPASPAYVGQTEFADLEEGNAHSAALAQDGNVLIQTDEDFDVSPVYDEDGNLVTEQAWGYPRWFDLSDRANPEQIATFELPTTRQHPAPGPNDYTVHDPKVRGNTAFFSWYAEGVVVVDFAGVRNGREPSFVAQWTTPTPNPSAEGVAHPWGDDPQVWGVALEGDLVLASDMNSGLYVLELQR